MAAAKPSGVNLLPYQVIRYQAEPKAGTARTPFARHAGVLGDKQGSLTSAGEVVERSRTLQKGSQLSMTPAGAGASHSHRALLSHRMPMAALYVRATHKGSHATDISP